MMFGHYLGGWFQPNWQVEGKPQDAVAAIVTAVNGTLDNAADNLNEIVGAATYLDAHSIGEAALHAAFNAAHQALPPRPGAPAPTPEQQAEDSLWRAVGTDSALARLELATQALLDDALPRLDAAEQDASAAEAHTLRGLEAARAALTARPEPLVFASVGDRRQPPARLPRPAGRWRWPRRPRCARW
jgi:hypothetical protein